MRFEKDKEVKEVKEKIEGKSKTQVEESNKKIQALQKRVRINLWLKAESLFNVMLFISDCCLRMF